MFDGLVERYDLLNTAISLGMDRGWRRRTAAQVLVRPGQRVLDLGCGTGRLGALASATARVVGVDVSHRMLLAARDTRRTGLTPVQASAFRLPFADGSFAGALSGFVLRNLDDLGGAFAELARVVAPGGRVALVDATEPPSGPFRRLFDLYFRSVAPAMGALVGKRAEYRYLAASLAQIPPGPEVCRLLERAGFEDCRATPMSGGAVTLFTATRSRPPAPR